MKLAYNYSLTRWLRGAEAALVFSIRRVASRAHLRTNFSARSELCRHRRPGRIPSRWQACKVALRSRDWRSVASRVSSKPSDRSPQLDSAE